MEIICTITPALKAIYFWSDGCASQFCSKFVFCSLCFYSSVLKIYWDYGNAHHFKGPHDGIGGTVKHKIQQDVTTGKVIAEDAKSFANFANNILNVKVVYLDKSEIISHDLSDAMHIHGTLRVQHVECSTNDNPDFYQNFPYLHEAKKLVSIAYQPNGDSSSLDEFVAEIHGRQQDQLPQSVDVVIVNYSTKNKNKHILQWCKALTSLNTQ